MISGTKFVSPLGNMQQLELKNEEEKKKRDAMLNEQIKQALDELKAKETTLGSENPNLVPMLRDLAELYKQKPDYTEAESLLQHALNIVKKAFGPEHLEVAVALRELALVQQNLQYFPVNPSERSYQDALAIYEKNGFPDDHPDVRDMLYNLARSYFKRKADYTQAEPIYNRTLAILEIDHGRDSIPVAESLYDLAKNYFPPPKYETVYGYGQENSPSNYVDVEPLLLRVLAIREKHIDQEYLNVVVTLKELTAFYEYQSNYSQAQSHLLRALAMEENVFGQEDLRVTDTLIGLAQICKEQANYNQAELHLLRALAMWKKAAVKKVLEMPDDTFQSFGHLRFVNDSRSQEEKDADYAQGKINRMVVMILTNLANVYVKQKKYTEAKQALTDVLNIQKKLYRTKDLVPTITSIADVDLEMNNFSEAKAGYKKAKDIWKEVSRGQLYEPGTINALELKLRLADSSEALYNKNKELKTANENLEREKQQKTNLIRSYSHTLSNTIFPPILYDIAERIKNNHELRKDALLLEEAYHAEISIIRENELLQMRYSSSTPEAFRQAIRKDRRLVTDAQANSIEAVINYTLSRVIARFLNQKHAKMEPVRFAVVARTGQTLEALRQDYENALFFTNPSQTALDWCNTRLRPIALHISSPLWCDIGIRRDGLTQALFYRHFAEIIFNAFKYADHSADWFLRIELSEREENGVKYLTICWENPTVTAVQTGLGSGIGLKAMGEDLRQLNATTAPETTLLIEKTNASFKLCLHYQIDLLRLKLKPKRDTGGTMLAKQCQPM